MKILQASKQRNRTLDCYKGILIILVVIRHVLQYSVADEGGILTNLIWAVQMPGFMLVSGYFAAQKNRDVGKSILKNCERYLMPFITWWILVTVLLLGGQNRSIIQGLNVLFHRVDGGLWFLWVIFVLSIVAAICNKVFYGEYRGGKKIVLAMIASVVFFGVLLAIVVITRNVNIFGIKYILYYAVFYGFGFLIRWTENVWKSYWNRMKDVVIFLCLIVFLAIVYNYDLYHCGDDLLAIVLRCVAGFTGNAVLLSTVGKFEGILSKVKCDWIGKYTLEIYATHMFVNNLFTASNGNVFWTAAGFGNFIASFVCTCTFTTIIIAVFKSIPAANYLMYGKRKTN